MSKSINVKDVGIGIAMIVVGIIGMGVDNETFQLIMGGVLIVGVIIIFLSRKTDFYCADCGQYLGTGRRIPSCRRCGCNVYTDEYTGSGRTSRHQDKY